MGGRAQGLAVAAMLVSLLGAGAREAAAADDRQTASIAYTTTEPGAPTGFEWSLHFTNPADQDAKPYSVAQIVIENDPGFQVDPGALPACTASDAELYAQGGAACPPATRIGGGELVSDTGSGAGFPRYVRNGVENFWGGDHIIGVADSADSPAIPGLTRIVTRSATGGHPNTTTLDLPQFPGNPPPDPYTALKSLRLSGPPIVVDGRALARTPSSCPASGHWTIVATFTYRDGVTQRVESPSPCVPAVAADGEAPRIRIRGVPRAGCAEAAFRARVRIRDDSALARAVLRLDGERLMVTRRKHFGLPVEVESLQPGRHRLVVRAGDVDGNASRRSVRFAACPA